MGTGSSLFVQSAHALHPASLGDILFVGLLGIQDWEEGSSLFPDKLQGASD